MKRKPPQEETTGRTGKEARVAMPRAERPDPTRQAGKGAGAAPEEPSPTMIRMAALRERIRAKEAANRIRANSHEVTDES